MNTGTQTLWHRDGHEETFDLDKIARMASCGQVGAGWDWSSVAPPPVNWEIEVPRYRATRDLQPCQLARYRSEPPFSMMSGSDVWQYCERPGVTAGQEISTTDWPHSSFVALNFSAAQVLEFFKSGAEKSRMTKSPWFNGRVRLGTGLSNAPGIVDRPPQPAPFNTRPAA
jgi:hypothetical protein